MSKIEFHEITLDDKTWMDARFQEDDRNACEYTFANNFVWRKVYHVEVADTPYETLKNIAIKRGYLLKGDIDENRLMLSFVKDIRENKCGLITWEKPNAC